MTTRRRRTGLLFTSAVVLGLLGGAGTGYAVQQHRSPTPLPPLAAAVLTGAPVPGDPSGDDLTKLNGDIRTLLLDRPAGAKDWDFDPFPAGWLSLADLATDWDGEGQAEVFVRLNSDGFRRIAGRVWTTSAGEDVEIRLIQFRTTSGVDAFAGGRQDGATPLDGTTSGYIYAFPDKNDDGTYTTLAQAAHGTVLMQVFVSSKTRPSSTELAGLAKQQLGKL